MTLTKEMSRRLVIDPWPNEPVTVDISADAAERHALAERFGLLDVRSLRGRGRLERDGEGAEVVVRGWLEADVVQACVVSLEPVAKRLRQPIERRYRPGGADDAGRRLEPHGLVALEDEQDEAEPIGGGEIDLGEAFAEELGLALDPYPRAAGAALDVGDLGPHVSVGSEHRSGAPLDALRQWQEKYAR